MTSDRVMMNVLSVLKSRTSTAGLSGVIIVESRSTGVEMSTNGNAGCMIDSTGSRFTAGLLTSSLVQVQVVERADHALVAGNGNLREVVLAHQRHGVLDRLVGLERAQLARQPERHQIARRHAALLEEALLAHPVVAEHLPEIARSVVVKDDDHELAGVEVILQLNDAGHRGAGRVAREDALFARDAARHHRGILVGHLLEVIDDREVDVLRQKVFADALGDVGIDLVLVELTGLFVLLEDRPVGVDAPDLDRRGFSP